uniref:NR LBD domain-containing protein n=1 Tax=Ascaris lumbricoides TaxID=6252 RepID=A0A0M3HGR0_ASCLU
MMDRLKTNRDVDFTMEDQMELIGDELALLKSVFLICLADKLALGSEMKRAFQRRRSAADEPFSYKNLIAVLKAVVPNSPRFGAFEMAELVLPTLEAIFMDGPDYVLFQVLG